jgi:hypothetical protein
LILYRDLDKLENDTLEECAKIFQLEGLQKTPLQQFLTLSQSDVESLLNLKRLNIGEVIDCLNTTNEWVEATVLNVIIQLLKGFLIRLGASWPSEGTIY